MVDFTIKNLEIFVEVVERSSFSQAAENLYLSQSSISSAISALEKSFGVQLLERTARKKVELTSDGEILYPLAKQITEKCNDAQRIFQGGKMQSLLIGCMSSLMHRFMPELMQAFLKEQPECRFIFESGTDESIHDMLRDGTIRIGFVANRQGASIFSYVPVERYKYVLATAPTEKYLALKEAGATGEQLLMEPMIAGVDRILLKYIKYFGIPYDKLNIVARVKNADAVKAMIMQNVGVSVSSMLSIKKEVEEGKLLAFDLKKPGMEREITMVYRNDIKLTPCEQKFISFVTKRNRID